MSTYNYYYDESEHSRKINYETIVASNYYDNFVSVIVGWTQDRENTIFCKYADFEDKYKGRKDNKGELKSTTLRPKNFEYGFASLNKQNLQFVDDFLSIFNKDIHLYFAIASKIEYLVLQLFSDYRNGLLINTDAMKYSITKALVVYRTETVIKCIYETPELFVDKLKIFFRERIENNKKNLELKQSESDAFEHILNYLESISVIPKQHWDYHISFDGFRKYLQEKQIDDYLLTIDQEGNMTDESKTLQAAREVGLYNCKELNSLNNYGLRIADMMAGIISKLLKALCDSLTYRSIDEEVKKKLLHEKWFIMKESQLELYKKLYKIICVWDHAWYKSYAGIYSDDLVTFIALLNYMNHFESVAQINAEGTTTQNEYFNSFVCELLQNRFKNSTHKLSIEPISFVNTDFSKQKGSKNIL